MNGLWRPRVLGAWRMPAERPGHPRRQPRAQHRRPDADGHRAPAGALPGQAGGVRRPARTPSCAPSGSCKVDRTSADRRPSATRSACWSAAACSGYSPRAPAATATSPSCAPGWPTSRSARARPSCRSRCWAAPASRPGGPRAAAAARPDRRRLRRALRRGRRQRTPHPDRAGRGHERIQERLTGHLAEARRATGR